MFNSFLQSSKIFAASTCDCVDTLMFGKICSDGSGNGIFMVLALAIQILTIGIGVLATIGIVFFGIQFLTSSDDPIKVKKAKSRILNIVIGLVAYALIFSVLNFLLPNFDPNVSGDKVVCEETEPDPEPTPPPAPDPIAPDEPDAPDEPISDPDERSPLCGPEASGSYGALTDVKEKQKKDGSTSGTSKQITKKYTTTNGRVYYVFKQANPVWANIPAGNKVMKNYGCLRTSYATILRSFGADVTPADFAHSLSGANKLRDKYAKEIFGNVGTASKNIADKIWSTLTSGGAAIVRVHAVFTDGQHHMPLVDYRIKNGKKEVYIANTTYKYTGWYTLDKVVKDGKADYVYLFNPKITINCK